MIKELLSLLYPRRCPICGDIAVPRGSLSCDTCRDVLWVIREPRCKKCGKPIEREEQEYCYDCMEHPFQYRRGISLWVYNKTMKRSIADFKYHGRKEYADFYVSELVSHHSDWIMKIRPDVLVPVPIHPSRLKVRGFNQADLLAQKLGKALSIPVSSDLLVRTRKTLPQKGLNEKERRKNLAEAFGVNDGALHTLGHIRRVILIDDIYTTGSTIDACAKVLIHKGNMDVYFLSLCIGKGF